MQSAERTIDFRCYAALSISNRRARERQFLSCSTSTPERLAACLELAAKLKRERARPSAPTWTALAARHVAMLFESRRCARASRSRSRIRELGATRVIPADVAHGGREPAADVARNLERWVDAVVIRTYAQQMPGGVRRRRAEPESSTRSPTRSTPARRWPTC